MIAAFLLLGCGGSDGEPRLGVGIQRGTDTTVVTCRAQYCSVQLHHAGWRRISIGVAGDTDDHRHREAHAEISGLRNLRVELGDGTNGLWAFQLAFSDIANLSIVTGDGDDDVRLDSTMVSERVRVTTGGGADFVRVFASEGNLGTDVDTGPGADALEVSSAGSGPARFATGDGDDVVTVERYRSATPLVVDTGSGDDAASVTVYPGSDAGLADTHMRFVGGPGHDRFDVTGTSSDDELQVYEFELAAEGTPNRSR